jgi:hypothetical protein
MTEATARDRDPLEIVAAVLLALAAVATAWSSYQATRWHGEQARATSRTNAIRIEAVRESTLGNAQTEVDVATFIQWVDAHAQGDAALETFYEDRFRPEFSPAFEAWIATDPFETAGAPPTPFAMDEYQVEATDEAEQLDRDAAASAATVTRNIQRASNYVLAVVLFAVALFFAGISSKLRTKGPRTALVVVGWLIFLGTVAWIATFPVSLSV